VQGEKKLTALDGSCQPSTGQKSLWMAKHTTVSNDHASDFFSFPLFCEAKRIGLYQNWPKLSEVKWFYFKFWRKLKMFDGNFVFLKAKKRTFPFFNESPVWHRPGLEWGTWGDPQELKWFLPLIKPLRRTRTLRDLAQTQVWSKQVWLDTTFISQGSRSWGKLVVETWRVKTELIIITILHIIITTISNLNLSFKTIAPKILGHTKCINKYLFGAGRAE
jgi:hypothetical protein